MAEPHDIDERTVSHETRRVLPLLKDLSPDNRLLLRDFADGATDQELADDYTSGKQHVLASRLGNILYRQLCFVPEHRVEEVRAALERAFAKERQTV